MEQPRINRVIELMKLLTDNTTYSVETLSFKLGLTQRTIYRYIESFKEAGFLVTHKGTVYSLIKENAFLKELSQLVYFTEEDSYLFDCLVNSLDDGSLAKQHLKNKLLSILTSVKCEELLIDSRTANNYNSIQRAILGKQVVILEKYHSANGNNIRDRRVEPFSIVGGCVEAWCYDLEDNSNKLFKLSRAKNVSILTDNWSYELDHKVGYLDIFHFSGHDLYQIKLLLGMLSHNLILEEYPLSEKYMSPVGENHWLLETSVCDFRGAARFVVGLKNDIQIIDSPDFEKFVKDYISSNF